ncbi:MAG: 50S ribosomal protein L21 [Geminicoccaceae bacterium]|nr:50S ribosomal protein L21 [Geminicoccaceae bacterium]MCX8101617.1 50S ribosomal protein L21 [Geminicoccaceae bacterium]MDW8369688.1 50S ribosomal protein L21 [Geminicoccaceae bacterium]
MYAVIRTGGKQYRVAKNDVIKIERLPGEAGQTIEFTDVLMVGGEQPILGTPTVPGAKVIGTLLEQARGPKIVIFKKKRRKNYRRRTGHRQDITVVRITDIAAPQAA